MSIYSQTETMSRSELSALQGERLAQQVAYVYDRVPRYRAKMDAIRLRPSDIRSIADIAKLPFTEKDDLRDAYPFGLLAVPQREIVRLHASSGTTGRLTVVALTREDVELWSDVMARSLVAAGASADSIVHVAYGYGLFTGGLGAHYGAEKLCATVIPASSGNTARQIQLLRDFGATMLCCTPSYATYIADEIERTGIDISQMRLQSGVFGAEPWSDNMRTAIERKLHIKAYDIYGLSEIIGPGVSVECCMQQGMHVAEDYFFPEILDTDLNPAPYGTKGELLFTTLTKRGMPLLRYRTRDICMLDDTPCRCGRTHVRMTKILGRTDDMLIVRGINVFPSQIESVLLELGEVEPHYQIIVDRENNADTLEVRVELSEKWFSDEIKVLETLKARIAARLHSVLGLNAKVRLVEPMSISRSEGKARRVDDRRKML